jgi:putative transposase
MNTTCTHPTAYPTDMTNDEWAIIAPYVAPDPKIGSPRDVCMRCVVNALFYLVKTGCQWRMLPNNFPNYGTVYHHFRRWSADGTVERIAHDLRRQVRRAAGRDPEPSRGIVDSQSAPTAEAGGEVDFDTNKQIKGRKRFIITDTMGLILTLLVTHAAVSDTASAAALEQRLGPAPRLADLLVDQGFKATFRQLWEERRGITVTTATRVSTIFQVLPTRWIVERTFGWLSMYRRLQADYEYHCGQSENMVWLAHLRLLLKRCTGRKDY